MILSVLDTQPPAHLPVLVPALEQLGYHRYWATEHHSPTQSASPTIIAGLAAGITERMRIGTAGVLLRASSALRVAEDFATLELFFPGRIDLGVAGATPASPMLDELARDIRIAFGEAYEERVRRLVELSRGGILPDGTTTVGPQRVSLPELWLCGTGVRAAKLAGALGVSFAFHHYLASSSQSVVPGIGEAYRTAYVDCDGHPPRIVVAAYGHCAPTEEAALVEWKTFFGTNAPRPSFIGTPEQVAEQLATIAEGYGADELAVDCFAPSLDARIQALADIKDAVDGAGADHRAAIGQRDATRRGVRKAKAL
ncbi:MAG TPA: LLM class flavin-dependent oxidoreductase [Kofleriaceae bacterium]|nr:LLM class flavin-dependent oxidoreductase [Kofleriaceae bacterium]